MRWSLVIALALCSCGDKKAPPDPAGETDRPRDAAAGPAVPEPPVEPTYSAAQKKSYRKHLATGRRLAQTRKYGEAARAFEQALEVIPMDSRALSELGWAAFQAGDYDRARSANADAVRVARDANVRAASLYNLGRVAEAMGNKDLAAAQYRKSLELRPNRTVERRLAGLAQAAPRPEVIEYTRCGPSAEANALCACLIGQIAARPTSAGAAHDPLSCHREPRDQAGVELLFVGDEVEEWVHLIARHDDAWSSVALLGYVYNPEDPGAHEELEIARMESRAIGERTALWIETIQTRTDRNDPREAAGKNATATVESSEVRQLTLCSWPPGGGELTCALKLPLYESYRKEAVGQAGAGAKPAPGSPAIVRRLDIEVRDNGTAKVVLVEGDKSDSVAPLVGEHTLW